jgi:hypothetical protein
MKIILYGWIDHLNFQNEEPIHSIEVICAMHNTIANSLSLSLYIYIYIYIKIIVIEES